MRGIEYLELVSDSIMPEMLGLFSSEWDENEKSRICRALIRVLDEGGAVLGAYISDEEDTGFSDGGSEDFVSVDVPEDEPEEKPYDWYIEDEDDEPACKPVVGLCAVDAGRFGAADADLSDAEYVGMPVICVAPGFRGKGIGKGLFRRAARLARALGGRRLYIPAPTDSGTQYFFGAVGCTGLTSEPAGASRCPVLFGQRGTEPLEYLLFPKGANGSDVLSIEEYQTMAGEILDSLPEAFFNDLNGGVVVRPEKKVHEKSVPGAPMYVMGEYSRSSMMGRIIYLYYGSFSAVYGRVSRAGQRELLRGIIAHEFRHHMEWLSGTRELEEEDERGLRAYLMRFAGTKDKKRGPDCS